MSRELTSQQAEKAIQEAVGFLATKTKTRWLAAHMARHTEHGRPTFDPKTPTAVTDGVSIRFGTWACQLPLKQRVFVLAHEILHCVLQHPLRNRMYRKLGIGPDLKPIDFKRANVAEDYNINATLLTDLGFHPNDMPSGGLFDSQYTPEMTADEIYCQLDGEDASDQGEQSDNSFDEHEDAPDDGSGDGDQPDPKTPQEVQDIIEGRVKQALNAAQSIGALPGGLKRRLSKAYAPKVHWTDLLRDYMEHLAQGADTVSPRPNRRRLVLPPHPYFPSSRGTALGTVVIAPDVSGSISEPEYNLFMTELKTILAECQPEALHLISWDTSAVHTEVEDDGDLDRVAVHGGGGTEYASAVAMIESLDLEPELVICMTDGMVGWPDASRIRWPHITLSTTHYRCPVGETIYVSLYD